MTCTECGGVVRLALTGYYCTDCDATWELLSA